MSSHGGGLRSCVCGISPHDLKFETYMRRKLYAIVVAGCVAGLAAAQAQTTLSHGHADVGVAFEGGAWDLHVHDGETNIEFEPGSVVLEVHGEAMQKVPEDARYAFLGAAGSPVWVLPEAEDHELLFLGLAAEEIEVGVFVEEQITVSLKGVEGPGDFILYHTDAFGSPVVTMNSADGIDEADARVLAVGSHSHVNWAFTQPGAYRISLQSTAALVVGGTSTSPVTDYFFEVDYAPMLRVRERHGGGLTLEWLSREHHEYQLESATDPTQGAWAAHPGVDPVVGDGGMMSVTADFEEGNVFLRLAIHEDEDHGHHHEHD